MTESELKAMADRFIRTRRDYEKAHMAAIDAKSMLSALDKSRNVWTKEFGSDSHGAQTGPGLHTQNVVIAARVEAEFRRDSAKYEDLLKAEDSAKSEMLSAWEAIVGASL